MYLSMCWALFSSFYRIWIKTSVCLFCNRMLQNTYMVAYVCILVYVYLCRGVLRFDDLKTSSVYVNIVCVA